MICLTFSENSPLSQDCADTSSRRKERAGWCRSNSAGIGVQDLPGATAALRSVGSWRSIVRLVLLSATLRHTERMSIDEAAELTSREQRMR